MTEKKAYKIIKEEISKTLFEEEKNSGGVIGKLLTKFYMFIIKNDLESAKETLKQNPELQKTAEEIKQQSELLAKQLLKNPKFVKYLLNIKDEE